MTIERIRGKEAPAEVLEYLQGREPASTGALAALMRPGRHWKLWLVRRDNDIAGLLLSVRYCFDRWTGVLLLDDLGCSGEMATALDRSNIWALIGPADGLDAVMPLTRRGRGMNRTWFHFMPYLPKTQSTSGEAELRLASSAGVTVRRATDSDLRPLLAFYASEDRALRPPWRRVRSTVRRALPYTLVAESPRGVVGAIMLSPANDYVLVNRTVVDPALRGGRVAFLLILHAARAAMAEGKGFCGFRVEPNGLRAVEKAMRSSHADALAFGEATAWASAGFWPPKRFRGQNRLRWLVERLEDRVGRPDDIRAAS